MMKDVSQKTLVICTTLMRHKYLFYWMLCLAFVPVANAQMVTSAEYQKAFQARNDSLITYFANATPANDLSKGDFFQMAAKLYRGKDMAWCLARVDTLVQKSYLRGDMFWMYPITFAMGVGKNRLPNDAMKKLRDTWQRYMPYRGDTENHWAMYHASLYVVSELFPNEPGETWYSGKSSEANKAEAKDYLIQWMDLTTSRGQGEYDSPDYLREYIAAMSLVYAFAQDPEMRQRARMMLDYLFADFAVESLNGMYGGAHSRIYPVPSAEPINVGSSQFAWQLWGQPKTWYGGDALILAVSGYEPPPQLYGIATDRSTPYVEKELKRTRHRWRYSDLRNAPVYKYSYVRKQYIMGSSNGGLLQPIQQQTWSLKWSLPDMKGKHNSFHALHPYASGYEGAMYFAEPADMVTDLITRSKNTYDLPDKFTGGSPFEQVFQQDDALIALYNIPEGERYPHINAFFPKDLTKREVDASGWIFMQGGDAFMAFYPLQPYEWTTLPSGDIYWKSPHLKNGYIFQAASATEFASFDAFKQAVKRLPITKKIEPSPMIRFKSLRGVSMEATYGQTPKINGVPINYSAWKLFDSKFLHADKDSRKLEIRYGNSRRLLDFNALTITDQIIK
jgi:hypothetical protein